MKDKNGITALMRATCNNNLECVRLLASKEGDIKLLIMSIGKMTIRPIHLNQQPQT